MRGGSPRAQTSAMMSATARSTSRSISRLADRNATKSTSKPDRRASSLSGIGGLANPLDPAADLVGIRLQRHAVDHQPSGHVGDVLDLDQVVRPERRPGRYEIDDTPAQAERRRQFHRAAQLDAFGLPAARGEVAPGGF